ncbi:MAG: LytTR family DNA-binding domain-containing protein [Butyrivibrio sp.]|nr:LytTR family DNA-binding domain-containing protein [Butyrivibrio sp.]
MSACINVAICDDEAWVHDEVMGHLKKYSLEKQCQIQTKSYLSSRELLSSGDKTDILFLDIEMPGMDGIETARNLDYNPDKTKIVMLTGNSERFKEAFQIGAYRYVTKPIDEAEFYSALGDAIFSLKRSTGIQAVYEGEYVVLPASEVSFIRSYGGFMKLYSNGRKFDRWGSLNDQAKELKDDGFFMCHKSYVVNLKYVTDIKDTKTILSTGDVIPVSRRRRRELIQEWIKYDLDSR